MKYAFTLCAGRHTTPAKESIFQMEVNPLDMDVLYAIADSAIPGDAAAVDLYVTGLTAATLAVVSVCVRRGIALRAWHYNRDNGQYIPQTVLAPAGWNVEDGGFEVRIDGGENSDNGCVKVYCILSEEQAELYGLPETVSEVSVPEDFGITADDACEGHPRTADMIKSAKSRFLARLRAAGVTRNQIFWVSGQD